MYVRVIPLTPLLPRAVLYFFFCIGVKKMHSPPLRAYSVPVRESASACAWGCLLGVALVCVRGVMRGNRKWLTGRMRRSGNSSYPPFSFYLSPPSPPLSILLFNTAIEPVANKYSCGSSWAVAANVSCLYLKCVWEFVPLCLGGCANVSCIKR